MRRMYLFTIVIASLFIFLVLGEDLPEVTLQQGKLVGIVGLSTNGRQFHSFLGLPYAEPPIGKLRFREAVPSEPWNGTFLANKVPNMCLQYTHFRYEVIGNEDCLYINVFTPMLPNTSESTMLMDVIVYIHGGAFTFSSGHDYGPQNLLDKDVVFVNFNYRVGPLGFLSTEDEEIPGNYGLKDQVLALKWVKNNIAAFGGNPESITIAGMSAGGVSVHYHTLSPLSKGLFKNAISMSGSALCPWAQTENSREKAWVLGKRFGCPANSSLLLECLQKQPAEEIVRLTKEFMPWLFLPFTPFGPVVERGPGAFIDKKPIDIVTGGPVSDVPLLMSFTSQEGLYPAAEIICNKENLKRLLDDWDNVSQVLLDYQFTSTRENIHLLNKKVWDEYLKEEGASLITNIIQMLSHRLYVANIVQAAAAQSKLMSSPVYAYEFSYRGKNSASDYFCVSREDYGASHADDLGYVVKADYLNSNETEDDIKMKNIMVDLWLSFAGSGNPSLGGLLDSWPTVKDNLPLVNFVNIISPDKVEVMQESDLGNLDFWESLNLQENNATEETL